MGLSRPKIGTLHGYVGRALAPYCQAGLEKTVLVGNPTFKQLQLIADAMVQNNFEGVTMSGFIVKWCDSMNERPSRNTLEQNVLYILKNCPVFTADFKKKITQLWMDGAVDLDPEYFIEPIQFNTNPRSKWADI
jgi:hypothetical protein